VEDSTKMRPELWAAMTAVCWAVGSCFEKKGVKLGGFTPVMGTAVRTAVSLVVLTALSAPFWGELAKAGWKPIALIAFGGGVLAGGAGLICLYKGLATGELSKVLAVSFCLTPVIGGIIGMTLMGDGHGALRITGIVIAVARAALVTLG